MITRAGRHMVIPPIAQIRVIAPASAAAAPPGWWVVAGATCVAAYQPKGASSLANSYVNLANPGTNDAAPGTAPTWAALTGWTFDGATQYLTCGITPTATWTLILRMANIVAGDTWAFGNYNASGWGIQPRTAANETRYYNGSTSVVAASRSSGVWALCGAQGYYNGVPDGAPTDGTAALGAAIFVGDISGAYRRYFAGDITVLAIYNSTLTAGEVATLSAAMAAL